MCLLLAPITKCIWQCPLVVQDEGPRGAGADGDRQPVRPGPGGCRETGSRGGHLCRLLSRLSSVFTAAARFLGCTDLCEPRLSPPEALPHPRLAKRLACVQNPTSCFAALLHLQTKQQLQRVEAEVSRLHGYIAQLDHASRAKEATIQQLKERLADGVARAERLARRDAEAYARLRGAHLASRGDLPWHPAPEE